MGSHVKRRFWREVIPTVMTVSVLTVAIAVPAYAMPSDEVEFTDLRLKTCVAEALMVDGFSVITQQQLASLTGTLSCRGSLGNVVTDIEPLRYATNLTGLDLQGNYIQDLSPLEGLSSLTALNLQGGKFTDASPLADLTHLTYLDLSRSKVTDLSPLAGLTNLTTLNLESTRRDDGLKITDVSDLSGLTELTTLKLSVSEITDLSPLSGMVNLTHLEAFDCQINDLSPLAGLTGLTELYIGLNPIADASPLGPLTNLGELYLAGTQVSDVSPLAGLTSLTSLHLYENQIADISPLESLSGLTSLSLEGQRLARKNALSNSTTAVPILRGTDGTVLSTSVLSGDGTVTGNTVTWLSEGPATLGWSGSTTIGSATATFSGKIPYNVDPAADKKPGEKFGPGFETASLANGRVGVAYTAEIRTSGVDTPALSLSGGALPRGVALDTKTGKISGTPTASGSFTFEVKAMNSVGVASRQYDIVVGPEQPRTCDAPSKSPVFIDTPVTHRFYKEIDWLHCMGYATGTRTDAGLTFEPKLPLTREAMAAFVFRMEAPKNYSAPSESPFADVGTGDKFYREIAWMWERGLSTGTRQPAGKPLYAPKQALTREAMAAFIYRLEAPEGYQVPQETQLADMTPGMAFYAEISWMYEQHLTTGNRVGITKEYWPKNTLTREAMAAFIYRLAHRQTAENPNHVNSLSHAEETEQTIELSARKGFTVSLNPLGDASLENVRPLTRASYTQPAQGQVALGIDNEVIVRIPDNSVADLSFEVTLIGQNGHKETLTYLIAVAN